MPPWMQPLRMFSQCAKWPREQGLHGGETPRTSQHSAGSTTTRMPSAQFFGTPAPISTVSPTISCPNTNGVETNGEKYGLPLQAMAERSEPQMPLKRVRNRTQSPDGSGGGARSASSMHDSAPVAAAG